MMNDIDLADLGMMAEKANNKVAQLARLSSTAKELGEKFERLKSADNGSGFYINLELIWQSRNGGNHRLSHFLTEEDAMEVRYLVLKLMAKRLREMLDTLYKDMERLASE